jgi:hypothetical protein
LVEGVRAYVVDAAIYLTKGFDTKELETALEVFQAMQPNAVKEMNKTLFNPYEVEK